jgi:hypothetical protein
VLHILVSWEHKTRWPHITSTGPGRLPPGPWFLTGVPAEASGVKRDFACTLTCPFPPELVALRSRSRLMLEGARTHSKPTPDLRPAKGSRTFALSGNVPGTIRA